MALLTTLEKLENVQAAIQAAELAQAYSTSDNSKQMASLETLYKRERELEAQYAREQRTSGARKVQYVNPER